MQRFARGFSLFMNWFNGALASTSDAYMALGFAQLNCTAFYSREQACA